MKKCCIQAGRVTHTHTHCSYKESFKSFISYQLGGVRHKVPDDGVGVRVAAGVRGPQLHILTLNRFYIGLGHNNLGPYTWMKGEGEENTKNHDRVIIMLFTLSYLALLSCCE